MATELDGAGPVEGGREADGGRRPEGGPPGFVAGPDPDAAARAALGGLVRRLATAAPNRRVLLAAAVRDCSTPGQLAAVAEYVAEALLRARSPSARAGHAATLVALGPAGGAAVGRALLAATTAGQRAALAGVAEAIGPALPRAGRVDLLVALIGGGAGRPTVSGAAVAVGRAATALRASIDSGPDR